MGPGLPAKDKLFIFFFNRHLVQYELQTASLLFTAVYCWCARFEKTNNKRAGKIGSVHLWSTQGKQTNMDSLGSRSKWFMCISLCIWACVYECVCVCMSNRLRTDCSLLAALLDSMSVSLWHGC